MGVWHTGQTISNNPWQLIGWRCGPISICHHTQHFSQDNSEQLFYIFCILKRKCKMHNKLSNADRTDATAATLTFWGAAIVVSIKLSWSFWIIFPLTFFYPQQLVLVVVSVSQIILVCKAKQLWTQDWNRMKRFKHSEQNAVRWEETTWNQEKTERHPTGGEHLLTPPTFGDFQKSLG